MKGIFDRIGGDPHVIHDEVVGHLLLRSFGIAA